MMVTINTVLKSYAKNPWKLWIVLQAGGFTVWVILITMLVWVINHVLADFIVNNLGLSVQAVRGAMFLTCGLSILSSHLLWREMVRTFNAKHLRGYLKHGKHAELFANDKAALAAREQYLTKKDEARRLKNNNSRNGARKRATQEEPIETTVEIEEASTL
jgi:hypothetical protein